MKVVAVLGSPRKEANSSKLVQAAVGALPQAGLEVQNFELNRLKYQGCQACMACKGQSDICVLKDDLTPLLAAVAEADLVIMASPVYIGEITGQLKCCIDRFFSYMAPAGAPARLAPGKKMLLVLTHGAPDQAAYEKPVLGHYSGFFTGLGFQVSHFIAPGQGPDDITAQRPEQVKALTDQVAAL